MSRNDKGPRARSPEEIKLIEDAQNKLILTNGVDMADAYRLMQKKSMDRCVSMVEIARDVLDGGDEYYF